MDHFEVFDVIVMPNLYGDILSDIAAQISGSVGMAGSSNIGESCAMFEAIHGSAPRRAGQNLANPSGLLNGAILMLKHIGQGDIATKIENAWLKTIEEGYHTYDIFQEGISVEKLGTKEFAQKIIQNLGKLPSTLKAITDVKNETIKILPYQRKPNKEKKLVGVDLFVHWNGLDVNNLAEKINLKKDSNLELTMITNRGIKVWPNGFEETFCTDHWRCRFKSKNDMNNQEIVNLLNNMINSHLDIIKTENLYHFDGKQAYSMGQGQ